MTDTSVSLDFALQLLCLIVGRRETPHRDSKIRTDFSVNASEGPTVTSTKLYFDTPGIINSPWVATKCSVSGGTHQLSCTSGPKAVLETCDIVAPRGATYIATTPPNNCQPLTMTAIPFTPTP